MGNQFDVAAGARLESTGRAPSNDEIVPRFSLDDINQAFDNNEFCFYLQPKCNAETGAIVGAEALVRWNHPEYGLVSPGEFIPLLERESMVTRFDLFILRSVCEMLSRWDGEGRNLVPVSVNVSMTDIEAIDVARVLGDLLDRFSIDARLLQVEITESAIAHNMDVVEETIRDLHARGIAVLMDFVPVHFAPDADRLACFDGAPLFESGPSDWGSLNFDLASPPVRSFLLSSAAFWLQVCRPAGGCHRQRAVPLPQRLAGSRVFQNDDCRAARAVPRLHAGGRGQRRFHERHLRYRQRRAGL